MRAVLSAREDRADLLARPRSGRRRPALQLMRVALLRDVAAGAFVSIAQRLGMSPSTPKKQYRLHVESMDSADYATAYAGLISEAVQALHGNLLKPPSG